MVLTRYDPRHGDGLNGEGFVKYSGSLHRETRQLAE